MPSVFGDVEFLCDLSEHVGRPLHVGEELGLFLGDLTEDFCGLLSLVPELLLSLPGALFERPVFFSGLPVLFGLLTLGFPVLAVCLIGVHGTLLIQIPSLLSQ
jgi:hypothetical protein